MASTINYVGEQQFNQVVHAMLALATIFTIARACVQARRRHPMEPQDYLLYTGYILFLAMSVAMSMVSSKIFMIHRVRSHLISPPVTLKADLIWCVRMVYACNVMFLLSLWMVKLSFMALYKKLIKGLPGLYTQLWWGVMVFCLVSLCGGITVGFMGCSNIAALIQTGICPGGSSHSREVAAVFTVFAVDVVSDLMIMTLPIRIAWNLQVRRRQKIAIIALFASGFVCIAFATLRVIQVGLKSRGDKEVDPVWLGLWSTVEGSVAICIGCCPAFAVFYRTTRTQRITNDRNGYRKHTPCRSDAEELHPERLEMNTVHIGVGRTRASKKCPHWDDTRSSQEILPVDNRGITVTTTLHQDHEPNISRKPSMSA